MIQLTQTAGALFGVLAVVLGAFGAHALKKVFTQNFNKVLKQGFDIKCIMPFYLF